jgi:hypothetical protein
MDHTSWRLSSDVASSCIGRSPTGKLSRIFYTIRDRASREANRNSLILCGAVNLFSRIKAIAKSLDLPLIVRDDFAHAHGGALKSLGRHRLRGRIHDGCGFLDNIDQAPSM